MTEAKAGAQGRKAMQRAGLFTVLRHPSALWRFFRDKDAPKAPRVLAVLALLYVVLPFDLVPDLIPVVGWLDDLGVASLALGFVASRAAAYSNEKQALLPEKTEEK